MNSLRSTVLLLLSLMLASIPTATRGEEGMYPISELGSLNLKARGLELTADQLFNADPNRTSLVDGICRVNGCTGSFVSPQGLIITNHHCAYGAIQKASNPKRDLLRDGFHASSLQDEIPAPDYQVRITESYEDVSSRVLSSVDNDMTFLERTKAIQRRMKELELAAEKRHPGLRAEVAEMFAGKTYVLFLYTYLKDVRLVFAPPQSVGNFGGEIDNWEWPRHTGDFSFMRAYTAPDGSSATYSPDNKPYQPKRFVQVQPRGVEDGDAVFLLGYPGRTARHKTASFLDYEQKVRLPLVVELYQWQISVMQQAGRADRDVEIKLASRMRGLANVEKRSRGQLKGLRRANIADTRRRRESELQAFIQADARRAEQYGDVLKRIGEVYDEMGRSRPLEAHLVQLRSASRALAFAHTLVEAAHQRELPDLDRESAYTKRNWPQTLDRLKASVGDYDPSTDQKLLAGMLSRLASIQGAVRTAPALRDVLASPDAISEAAATWIAATRCGDWEFLESGLDKTPAQLRELGDPILTLACDLYPTYLALRDRGKERDGKLSRLYGDLIDVKQQFEAARFIPDANATLRMTIGRIRSYSPEDAVIRTPITSFRGVLEKTTGQSPFDTPARVVQAYRAGNVGQFASSTLDDLPVAILYDTDTTGGNSGSPIFNSKGELVGVNFDRCFEATINDFAWNQDYSRSIGVDIRYVLWVTGVAYDAKHLLKEMGVSVD